jgi:hypothetical protein
MRSLRRFAVSITPIAISSLKQKIAVGGSAPPSNCSAAVLPDSIEKLPFTTMQSSSAS